ncbi:protein STPG4 [Trichechus inunguis]
MIVSGDFLCPHPPPARSTTGDTPGRYPAHAREPRPRRLLATGRQPQPTLSRAVMDQPVIALSTTAKPTRKSASFEREGWWRTTLTNTPIPGTYHLRTFIEESLLNPVIATYNFKNEGRKKPPLVHRNYPVINDIPQYMPPDSLDLLKKQMATYSFKDKPRASPSSLVYKDQTVQLSPGQYDILPAPVPKYSSRGFVFRSTVPRFPTGCFIPVSIL